ncbi:MAG: hypothetical protein JWQ55_3195 [Rhodopila sp.]|nr:hypothetical protein [Rhodopila sp.]
MSFWANATILTLMPNWRRGRPLQVRHAETEAEAAAALAELDAARAAHATTVEAHAAAEKAAADHATALQASQTELQRREATLLQQNDELAALRGQHAALEQAASRQDRLEAALAEVERTLQPRTRALAAEATEAERCRAAFGRSSAVALDRLELLAETISSIALRRASRLMVIHCTEPRLSIRTSVMCGLPGGIWSGCRRA